MSQEEQIKITKTDCNNTPIINTTADQSNFSEQKQQKTPSLSFWRAQKSATHPFLKKLTINIAKPNCCTLSHSNTFNEIPQQLFKDYEIIEQIGSGFQSNCFKIKHIPSNEIRVAKIAKYYDSDEELMNSLKEEYMILKNLSHPLLIGIYENEVTLKDNTKKFIQIMDYVPAKTLASSLIRHEFKEKEIIEIGYKLLQVADYLHKQRIIHRDINLYNVLYSRKRNILKLIDFGVAKQLEQSALNYSSVGNHKFSAPEMNASEFYTEKIDIWGIGITLYSLFHQKIIGTKQLQKEGNLLNLENSSAEFKEFMGKMLEVDQDLRVQASQALQLKIFKCLKVQ